MINVADILHDPDFVTTFIIKKKSTDDTWKNGVPVTTDNSFSVEGVVVPATSRDIHMLPEGDRRVGMMTFYADIPMKVSNTITVSDYCYFHKAWYKLISVFDWSEGGFFKAIGTFVENSTGCDVSDL